MLLTDPDGLGPDLTAFLEHVVTEGGQRAGREQLVRDRITLARETGSPSGDYPDHPYFFMVTTEDPRPIRVTTASVTAVRVLSVERRTG